MNPCIVADGLIIFLTQWAERANEDGLLVGLFQYPWMGDIDSDIDSINPCDFGGYDGLRSLTAWDYGAIEVAAPYATVIHPEIVWTADGSSVNMVGGYYVTTSFGVLLYVVPREEGSQTIGTFDGQTYTASPLMRLRTEFVEE